MSLLDGGIREIFGDVFGALYLDATLTKTEQTEDQYGDITEAPVDYPVKAHAPGRSEAYRSSAGFADGEVEIIVLQAGVPAHPTADDRLTYGGRVWSITGVTEDGAHSHWRVRARAWNG